MPDVGLIAADTSRSRAYLQAMLQSELLPAFVLLLEDPAKGTAPGQQSGSMLDPTWNHSAAGCSFSFNPTISAEVTLTEAGIPCERVGSVDINSDLVTDKIASRPEEVFIYSGVGGGILRERTLSLGKKYLHVHGGYLPDFKGSTTNYYSLLQENQCGASAIFLEKIIDGGPLLHRRKFASPPDRTQIDHVYDAMFRAEVLVQTLKEYAHAQKWKVDAASNVGGEMYYIIHPVLKHIAILGKGR